MNVITIMNLSKKYGEFTAVDSINLTIKQGELFSLLGVNGAGKTTTIKMLSCLIKPTGGDAVLLGNSIKAHPQAVKETAKRRAEEIATQFGLEDVRKKKAKHLSSGMQRRLSLAMALITNPQILFLDEPTLGLDVLARRELWASIRALKGNATIILTTHYLEEIEALSDRVGVMAKGKLTAIGTVAELREQTGTSNLEDAFVILAGGAV
jgi:ABC-2 type transport system ATP-binding protein